SRGQVIPFTIGFNPAVGNLDAVSSEIVPDAVNHLPAGSHAAPGSEVITAAVNNLPTGQHCAVFVEQIPNVINLFPAIGFHQAGCLIEQVPDAANFIPAGNHLAADIVLIAKGCTACPA